MRMPWALPTVLTLALAGAAGGTTIVPADLDTLTREARAIARGRVAAIEPHPAAEGGIETLVSLEVVAYLKGSLGARVQFRVPGGQLGRVRHIVVGAPEFAVGQDVIVFLGARTPGEPYLVGFSQGVFRLAATSAGWVVTPPVLASAPAGSLLRRGDPARRPVPLADFEREVRARVDVVR